MGLLRNHLKGLVEDLREAAPRRITGNTSSDRVKGALRILRDKLGYRHLSAISGVDTGEAIEIIYHVSARDGFLVSVRTSLPRDNPRVPTVTDIHPAANLYEREIRDLLGVEFEGHPDPRRLLLYEDWPRDEYPLRKDWKPRDEGGRKGA